MCLCTELGFTQAKVSLTHVSEAAPGVSELMGPAAAQELPHLCAA